MPPTSSAPINLTRRPYSIPALTADRHYRSLAREMRGRGRDMRRRTFLAALTRAHAASGAGLITGVEVGVRFGALSEYLLAECPFVARLLCVDPWAPYSPDHPDRQHHNYASRDASSWRSTMQIAVDRLPQFGGRAVISRTDSLAAARACAAIGEKHWFVYIDGSHAYADVLADLRAWWPIVAAGGILCGDDVSPRERWKGDQRDDVSRAVFEFGEEVGKEVELLHRNWFIVKGMAE